MFSWLPTLNFFTKPVFLVCSFVFSLGICTLTESANGQTSSSSSSGLAPQFRPGRQNQQDTPQKQPGINPPATGGQPPENPSNVGKSEVILGESPVTLSNPLLGIGGPPQQQKAPPPNPQTGGFGQKANQGANQYQGQGQGQNQQVETRVETYTPIPIRIDDPRLVLETSMGSIRIHLFPGVAPKNTRAVVELAMGEKEFIDVKTGKRAHRPFYNNMTFHRVVADMLIQTGCPFGNGRGGPGFSNPDEFHPGVKFNRPGLVAMAPRRVGGNFEKDSNGSQFFITLMPMPEWNDKYTIIGEVEAGLDIAQKISQVPIGPTDRPIKRVFLHSLELVDRSKIYSKPTEK